MAKKLRALAAFMAVALFASGTAAVSVSAENYDVSNPKRAIDVRVNKSYIQYDIVSDELENANNIPIIIRDKDGRQVARSSMVYDSADHTRHASVTTAVEDHILDFSDIKNAEDISKKLTAHNSEAVIPYYLSGRSENDLKDDLYYVGPQGTTNMPKYSNGEYYLGLDKDYYRIRSDTSGFEVVDTVTVPANKLFVDIDSKYVEINDVYTSMSILPKDEELEFDYSLYLERLYMYENAGKRRTFDAQAGRYDFYVSGFSRGEDDLMVYDHETTYKKIKVKFLDAFPGFCGEDLKWEKDFADKTYNIDMRGDQSQACFSALYHSGAAVSASIPDKDGYIYIWLKDDEPKLTMLNSYTLPDCMGSGSLEYMKIPITVDKIHSYFEYPTKRYCIYNLAPGEYTAEIDREDLKDDYAVLNSKFTVKDTQVIQSFDFKICPKDFKLGDVDMNGKVNSADITKTAAHIKGLKTLNEEQKLRADVNIDGKVNSADIAKIAAHIKGLKKLV